MTDLYNPFTGEVSKAVSPMYGAKDAFANQPTRKVASLLPTGKHVSHANDLHVTRHGRRKNVGRYGETKLERFGKADNGPGPASTGRKVTGALFPGYHGLIAGKRGRKTGAFGSEIGHATAGAAPGGVAQYAGIKSRNPKLIVGGTLASFAGARAGGLRGTVTSQRKGRYKAEEVTASKSDLSMQPGMINPGVVTSSWSHGTPNQNFAAASGRRGRKIA